MLNENTHKELSRFARNVVKFSRSNLTRQNKNTSKKLYNSMDFDLKVMQNSFALGFVMEAYGIFQDVGVSGTKKKYDTPYTYRDKQPPARAFDKWIVRKGLAPRDKEGKFLSRKTLAFLIARKIKINGIKPSLFFTKPFEAAFKSLPDELVEQFGLDIDKFLEFTTKQNLDVNV